MTAVRYELDVAGWMLHGNDDTPAPGRITVRAGCDLCCRGCTACATGDGTCTAGRRWPLPRGRWVIEHTHDGTWTAHLIRLEVPDDGRREARQFVDALAATR